MLCGHKLDFKNTGKMEKLGLAIWWDYLIQPYRGIDNEQELLRSRLFVSIQLLFILITTISLPLMAYYEATATELTMGLIAWLMSVSFYAFGRTRWHRLTVHVSSVLIYTWFLFILPLFPFPSYAMMLMALPLVLISLFHSVQTTLMVAVLTAPLLFGISILTPLEYPLTTLLSAIVLLTVGTGISLGTNLREQFTRRLALRAQQVEEREARYRQLFEITPLPLLVIDFGDLVARLNILSAEHKAGLRTYLASCPTEVIALFSLLRVLAVNEAARKLFETTIQRLLAEDTMSLLGQIPENRAALLDAVTTFAAGAESVEFELVLLTGTGRKFDSQVRWTSAPGYAPSSLIMMVSVEDISARKQAEMQRIELAVGQERVAFIQRFVGDVSHDLLTPLSVIRTSAYLAGRGQVDGSARERLATIDTQVEYVQSMVRDMLMLTRLEQPAEQAFTFETADVAPLLQQLVGDLRAIATHNEQALNYVSTGDALVAHHDREKLRRAVTNLINNALKYTPKGGKIWVRDCIREGEIVIEVQDTGIGIAADELPHVFNRFYRAKEHRKMSGGLGLGLSIAQKIVQGHQGSIEVESVAGSGATFRIRLPAVRLPEALPAASVS